MIFLYGWLIVDFTWAGTNREQLLVSTHNPTSEMIFLLRVRERDVGFLISDKMEEGSDIPAQQSQASYVGSNEIYHLLFEWKDSQYRQASKLCIIHALVFERAGNQCPRKCIIRASHQSSIPDHHPQSQP
jgi:hypothetical protein